MTTGNEGTRKYTRDGRTEWYLANGLVIWHKHGEPVYYVLQPEAGEPIEGWPEHRHTVTLAKCATLSEARRVAGRTEGGTE